MSTLSLSIGLQYYLTINLEILDKMCAGEETVCEPKWLMLLSDHKVIISGHFGDGSITIIITYYLSLH